MEIFDDDQWICVDCMMLIANGETDPEMSEQEAKDFISKVDNSLEDGLDWVLNSTEDEDGYDTSYDEFSWRRCDCCGSTLGGSRHRATILDYREDRPC